jgi:putative ABC transport system permease protein
VKSISLLSRLNLNTITLAVLRSAWKIRNRLSAIVFIAAFSVAIIVGTFSAITSLFTSSNQLQTIGHLANLELRFSTDDINNIPNFKKLGFIKELQQRIIFPSTIILNNDKTLSALIISYNNDSSINTLTLLSGQTLNKNDKEGVLIDHSLAQYHGIKLGDTLELKLDREKRVVHVRGIVSSAEFLLAPANPSLFVPTKGSLGIIYAEPELLTSRFGYMFSNSIIFSLDTSLPFQEERNEIIDLAQTRLNVDWTMSQREQFTNQFLNKDLNIFKEVIPVIAIISVLSSLVVTLFLFIQWIDTERPQIGILMTLGSEPKIISYAFFKIFILLAIIAIILGLFLSLGILNGFATQFASSIGLPAPQLIIDPKYIVVASILVLSVFSIAGLIVIQKILRMTPKEVITKEIQPLETQSESLCFKIFAPGPVWLRFAIRNLLRNPAVSCMSIIALALGLGLATSFFISFTSFIGTSIKNVERDHWDLVVDFSFPVWQENFSRYENIPGVTQIVPYTKSVIQALNAKKRINLYVGGIDPSQPARVLTLLKGQLLTVHDKNSILLEKGAAEDLNLIVGQTLTIESLGKKYKVVLKGIFSGTLPGEAYLPISFHQEISDLTERATGLFVLTHGNEENITKLFYQQTDVHDVLSKKRVINDILEASGQVTKIIMMGSMVNISIALLFIFASVTYNVLQRKREYLVFRLLGYNVRILSAMILTDIILLGVIAILLAIPIAYLIAKYLNYKLSLLWFQVNMVLTIKDYLAILIPGLILMPLVAIPIINFLQRVPLETIIKER